MKARYQPAGQATAPRDMLLLVPRAAHASVSNRAGYAPVDQASLTMTTFPAANRLIGDNRQLQIV